MSNLIRKLFSYGHNVHDCGNRVGYGYADRRGDGIVGVYSRYPAGFVRSSSLGFRDIRNPLVAPQGASARLSSFLQSNRLPLVAVAGLVIGLFLFVKPVSASVGVGDGSHYYSESPDVTLNVTDIADECTHGSYPNEDESRFGLEFWASSTEIYDTGYIGLGTGYCVNCDYGYRFSYPSIYAYFTDLAIPDGTYDTVKVYCYDDYHSSTVNGGAPVESNSYLIVINSSSSTPPEPEIDVTEYMGTVTWSESDDALAYSTSWTNRTNILIGDATNTFPICLVSPFFTLLDLFQGTTEEDLNPQGINLGNFMQNSTTTITLVGASTTLDAIGFVSVVNAILVPIKAILWLLVAMWVFNRLFGKREDENID